MSVQKRPPLFEATEEDLARAGTEGAKRIAEQVAEHTEDIRLMGRVKAGLITVEDICRLYGVKKRAVYDWPLEPADTPTQKNLYRLDEVAGQLAGEE